MPWPSFTDPQLPAHGNFPAPARPRVHRLQPTPAPTTGGASGGSDVKLCIPNDATPAYLAACSSALAQANTAAVSFSCVSGGSATGCQEMVQSGRATLVKLGGE